MADNFDTLDGIIIGIAVSVIGSVIAYKLITPPPAGGGNPVQPNFQATPQFGRTAPVQVVPSPLNPAPSTASPVQQTNANVEAAFNQGPAHTYEPAFNTNINTPEILPI